MRIGHVKDFSLHQGLPEKQITKLLSYSQADQAVKRFTSDPTRFANQKKFNTWFSQHNRILYSLLDDNSNLAGIIWFTQKPLGVKAFLKPLNHDNYGITFAIRTYGSARGKGLALPFMQKVFINYYQTYTYKSCPDKGFWLSANIANKPAINLYHHFGFQAVTKPDHEEKIIMVLPQ